MAENNVQDQEQIKLPDPIIFTDAASLKVKELIDEEGNPNLKLRVFVQGGGCSGFQYGFTFDETTNEDDCDGQKRSHTPDRLHELSVSRRR